MLTGWQEQWSRVYWIIGITTLVFLVGSLSKKDLFKVEALNPDNLPLQIGVGFLLGTALISPFLLEGAGIMAPLSVQGLQSVLTIFGGAALPSIFLLSFVASEFEETFRGVTLRPTLRKWVGDARIIAAFSLATFSLTYFLFNSFRALSLIMIFASGIVAVKPDLIQGWMEKEINFFGKKVEVGPFIFSILIASAIFSIMHVTKAGLLHATTQMAKKEAMGTLTSAFSFAAIAGLINTYFESTNASKIAHTINNAGYLTAGMAGISFGFVYIVGILHAVILYALNKASEASV